MTVVVALDSGADLPHHDGLRLSLMLYIGGFLIVRSSTGFQELKDKHDNKTAASCLRDMIFMVSTMRSREITLFLILFNLILMTTLDISCYFILTLQIKKKNPEAQKR